MSPVTITLSLLVFSIVMFVWEKIPLAVTAMIVCITLVVTGVFDVQTAFSGFINQNVILFVAMFVVGGALFETGVTDKIGGIVTRYARSEKQLIVIIMLVCGLLSGVLSNTGTAAVLIPVVIGAAIKSGYARSRLLMPLAFASALGGNLSLIGSPGNLIAQSALEQVGQSFGFFEYAKLGIPMLACGILYFVTIGYRILPGKNTLQKHGAESIRTVDCPTYKQVIALSVLIATVLGMIFEKRIGLPIAIIGSIGALSLVITRVITEKQAYQAIDSQTGNHRRWRDHGALNNRLARAPGLAFLTFKRRINHLLYFNQFYVEYGNGGFINADWPVYCPFDGRRSPGGVNGDCYRLFMRLCDASGNACQYDDFFRRRI